MAGNGYQRGGYTTHNGWDTHTDDWIQTNYPRNGNSDHVHHPVIVDAQGRERPISESYVTQTETVIERVEVPAVTEYKYSSPTEVESFNNYKINNDRWRWPKSTPVVKDRPLKVEVYVQTPTPTKFTPNSTGYNGNAGYGGYKNFSNSEKPDDYYRNRNDTFTDPTLTNKDGRDRPGSKGWAMQPHSTPLSKPTNDIGTAVEFLKEAVISTTQSRFGIPVSAVPKKDPYAETIGVEYPQKAVKPATVTFTEPPPSSTMTQMEPYGEIIDSREAPRQYANSNNSSIRPYKKEVSYTGVIDSRGPRGVARKYGGTYV